MKAVVATSDSIDNAIRQDIVDVDSKSWKEAYLKCLEQEKPEGWERTHEWVSDMQDDPTVLLDELAQADMDLSVVFIES